MLEFLDIKTWELTILVLAGLFIWGLLRERARRKHMRIIRGDTQKISRNLLIRASHASDDSSSKHGFSGSSYAPAGNYNQTHMLPLSGEPSNPDDRYVLAALGMEQNRQDFYRQAWDSSRNNEYLMMS